MEKKENQLQPLGVCQRLFNFFINSIVARGLKRITLGPPKAYGLIEIPITGSTTTKPTEGGGGIIAIGGSQTQLQKRKVPLQSQESKHSFSGPSEDKEVDRNQARRITDTRRLPAQENGSVEVVPPTATASEARGPKEILNIEDESEVRIDSKEKEKQKVRDREPDKGGEGKAPRSLLPIGRVASNIDDKLGAYIRSRKEALSRSGSDLPERASP